MILRRLSEAFRKQDWFTVAVETLIVVLGVFLGIQLGNLNEARRISQDEERLTERLVSDLENMRVALLRDSAIVQPIYEGWVHAFRALERCEVVEEHRASIDYAFSQYQRSFAPPIQRAAYDEMKSTGAFSRLPDGKLQNALTYLYSELDNELSSSSGGRDNQLAAGRIMWKYIAFSFVDDAETTDFDSWGTADFNPLDHCDNLELRGAVWEIVDTNRDQLSTNANFVAGIDTILTLIQETKAR